ncbi:MAG: riboflavin synthase [Solirubrobacteraceae bacterium]
MLAGARSVFTGLVAGLGTVTAAARSPQGARLTISTPLAAQLRDGDSIAVDGVCLTATAVRDASFEAEAMHVTLASTGLGSLNCGAQVNLELPLRVGDRFGGHLVQGHVDGVGNVVEVVQDGFARRLRIEAGDDVLGYVVEHGSIAVNGVSLTVAALAARSFTVSLIPETLVRTNLGGAQPGLAVNLEVDVIAKYVEKAVHRMARGTGAAP